MVQDRFLEGVGDYPIMRRIPTVAPAIDEGVCGPALRVGVSENLKGHMEPSCFDCVRPGPVCSIVSCNARGSAAAHNGVITKLIEGFPTLGLRTFVIRKNCKTQEPLEEDDKFLFVKFEPQTLRRKGRQPECRMFSGHSLESQLLAGGKRHRKQPRLVGLVNQITQDELRVPAAFAEFDEVVRRGWERGNGPQLALEGVQGSGSAGNVRELDRVIEDGIDDRGSRDSTR